MISIAYSNQALQFMNSIELHRQMVRLGLVSKQMADNHGMFAFASRDKHISAIGAEQLLASLSDADIAFAWHVRSSSGKATNGSSLHHSVLSSLLPSNCVSV